jgi:hypothetical protein
MRKRALLALSLPLVATGTLAGHAAGYALVGSSPGDRHAHGYLVYAPQFIALCLAVLALALALRLGGRLRGRQAAWPFALIPPLAFLAQELIERLVTGLPAHAVFEPAVYVGLGAQVPVAVLAFLGSRSLLRIADEAAHALAVSPLVVLQRPVQTVRALFSSDTPARLAFDRLGRAPPR